MSGYLEQTLRAALREAEGRALEGDDPALVVVITGARRSLHTLERIADRAMMGPARREKISAEQSEAARAELVAIANRIDRLLERNPDDTEERTDL